MSLESPFLDGELFVEADSVEPRCSLSNLESPFLQGFANDFLNPAAPEERYAEDADEYEVEDGRFFEAFAPKVSQADLQKRIDEYFDLANAEYTIPEHTLPNGTKVKESKVRARSQFHIAKVGNPEKDAQTVVRMPQASLGASSCTTSRQETGGTSTRSTMTIKRSSRTRSVLTTSTLLKGCIARIRRSKAIRVRRRLPGRAPLVR